MATNFVVDSPEATGFDTSCTECCNSFHRGCVSCEANAKVYFKRVPCPKHQTACAKHLKVEVPKSKRGPKKITTLMGREITTEVEPAHWDLPNKPVVSKEMSNWFRYLGKLGGHTKSPARAAASRRNQLKTLTSHRGNEGPKKRRVVTGGPTT